MEKSSLGSWAVIYKPNRELIGQCELQFLEDTPEVERAYAIAQAYWGKGITTEAAKTILK